MSGTTESSGIPAGETPVYLTISLASGDTVTIDLDAAGWATTFADYLRVRSIWTLRWKDGHMPPLLMLVDEGDQPYYTARHVGMFGSGGSNEIIAYGIGKKQPDGYTQRLWAFASGVVCAGDDVDRIASMMVQALGPR